MAIVDRKQHGTETEFGHDLNGSAQPLHRLGVVRRQQGVSLRSAARQLETDVTSVKQQEEGAVDLSLSDLYRWQEILDVPVADLLIDPEGELSRPIMERAQLLRLMKTAMAILHRTQSSNIRHLAQMLVEQLTEIVPELEEVSPWHAVGQRRSLDEYGRVAERVMPASELDHFR